MKHLFVIYGILCLSVSFSYSNTTNAPEYLKVIQLKNADYIRAILVENDKIHIGAGKCLYIYENKPEFKHISTTCLSAIVQDIQVVDTLAYIGHRSGLSVVNISDTENPFEISLFRIDDDGGGVENIRIKDKIAYVLHRTRGLYAIDVSDPQNMHEVFRGKHTGCCSIPLDLYEDKLLATGPGGYLHIYNISQPTEIEILNSLHMENKLRIEGIMQIAVKDTLSYLACHENGLLILNIKDAKNVPTLAKYKIDANATEVEVNSDGTKAFVVFSYKNSETYLYIFNMANPKRPKITKKVLLGGNWCSNFEIYDSLVYFSQNKNQLVIMKLEETE